MRKFKCVEVNNTIGFTKGKIYEVGENNLIHYDSGNECKLTYFIVNENKATCWSAKFEEVFEKKEEKKVNKFKVGDVVEIKDGNDIKNYTEGWSYGMCGNIGKKAKISSIEERNGMPCYKLCDFNYEKYTQDCVYDERGLELVEYPKTKTLTITTSDSTTTLSDGTHTTSINRYYTDKHDVKVAVNEVVKKYFDEVEREEKKGKMPKVGDMVKVVDDERVYSRYDDWMIENKIEYKYALLWQEGYSPENSSTGFIRAIHPHLSDNDRILALVETEYHAYIIDIEGLEVIK